MELSPITDGTIVHDVDRVKHVIHSAAALLSRTPRTRTLSTMASSPSSMASSGERKICVMGGLGHIGLPLSIRLSLSGWRVVAVDVNHEAVAAVNQGRLPFRENNGEALLQQALERGLRASSDEREYADAWAVVIVTGMDLDVYGNPRIEFVRQHLLHVADRCPRDALLLLRSTLYPGSMSLLERDLDAHLHATATESATDTGTSAFLTAAQRLAYCPERTSELFALEELESLPQLVSACSSDAFDRAYAIFRTIAPVVIRVSPLEAELAKLITNAWRYMEFGLSNEMFGLVQRSGVDFTRLLSAVRYNYPRASGFKLPGLTAGPCLLKDTRMLISFGGSSIPMAISAVTINEGLVDVLLQQLVGLLTATSTGAAATKAQSRHEHRELPNTLAGFTVGLLGMAFKPNSDDFRQSLSFKLRKLALRRGARVLVHDPSLTSGSSSAAKLDVCDSVQDLIHRSDGLILCVPHDEYRSLDVLGKPVVDVWGALASPRSKLELLPGTQALADTVPTAAAPATEKRLPTILVTGSAGFIGGYVVQELLTHGYHVIGIDNYSKYGPVEKEYDHHPEYEFYQVFSISVDDEQISLTTTHSLSRSRSCRVMSRMSS